MPVFTFSGKNESGEKISGERTAANKQTLTAQLRREQITAGSIREKGKEFALPTFGSGKVKVKEIAIFFRQFSVMIDAGLPSGAVPGDFGGKPGEHGIPENAHRCPHNGRRGCHAGECDAAYPKVFDDLTTNMIEAGETGGILDIILQRLALYVEKAVKLKSAVKSALIYPVAVVSLAVLDRGRAP